VQNLWNEYKKDVLLFQKGVMQEDGRLQQEAFEDIAKTNEKLLTQMDKAVDMYSDYTANKTEFIQTFQYGAFFVLFGLVAFSILKLKQIEMHAREFMKKSRQLMQRDIKAPIEPMDVDAENEIEEVADSLNHFIFKVNSAMELSNAALRQSKQASDKIEELTEEFNAIIGIVDEQGGSIGDSIDKSEDIMIQSSEEMVRTNQRLQELKSELDKVMKIFDQNQKT
jgi:methyl-accepting chemotaxis protein